ncbi:GNAT family N-acetyltransferase [Anabaena sphaerica FACHB-251]|uniref:GNAT family N-acetyltransferase n=1 Tax=Anabaena sphaerica FACHB-251 TaxID=2692883 RepID=A0A927A1R7_9NOST|nr:GNAT family N-acetyltransferase [Anabaena sphaerica]MBD2296482.1 GNAT family N-acetyltransferase [Anabaena sphaerica FACHB-251]
MSEISLEILNSNEICYKEIDTLFSSASNETLFHHPKFLSYHANAKFPDANWRHYLFREGSRLIGYLPGALVMEDSGCIYKSPFASSFGGLVYGNLNFAQIDTCLEKWWHDLDQQNIQRAEVILAPLPYSSPNFCEGVEFKLNQLGFQLKAPELCLIVPIDKHSEFPRQLFRNKDWRYLKQGREKPGSIIYSQELNDIKRFYPVLLENRKKHGVLPTHSLEEIICLHELFPHALHLFLATVDENVVAGILAFQTNKRVLNAFYQASNEQGRKIRAMNFLCAEVYGWSLSQSIAWVDLGSSSFGLEAHKTLINFKESCGGRKFLRKRYIWHRNNYS